MKEIIHIPYRKKPSMLSSYLKIIFSKRKGVKGSEPLPAIHGRWENMTADRENLKMYREACSISDQGVLPVLYPHVLASPVYMDMLTHREFPIPLLGSLHLRNHIIQHRQIAENETFTMDVKIGEKRIVKQGVEFDFSILLSHAGERLWESVTTWLRKGKFEGEYKHSPHADIIRPINGAEKYAESYIPADIGKRFAGITGDYNPIHISKLMAPLFGLKRDVAHAMWVCADTLRHLPETDKNSPQRIDLAFKGPLFLDSPSIIRLKQEENGFRFDTHCGDNPRPSIQGLVTGVRKGTTLH